MLIFSIILTLSWVGCLVLGIYLVYKTSNSSKKRHPVHRKNPRKSPEKKEPYKET